MQHSPHHHPSHVSPFPVACQSTGCCAPSLALPHRLSVCRASHSVAQVVEKAAHCLANIHLSQEIIAAPTQHPTRMRAGPTPPLYHADATQKSPGLVQ